MDPEEAFQVIEDSEMEILKEGKGQSQLNPSRLGKMGKITEFLKKTG